MTTRAQPPPDAPLGSEPPPGFRYEWAEDNRSRLATAEEARERKCRRSGCKRPPAIAFKRSNGWWLYCDWHTYGRRIVDGRVESRRMVPDAEATGMSSLPTAQLLVELEALALRLSIQQQEDGMGETDDAGLIRMAIERIEQLSTAQKMASDQ